MLLRLLLIAAACPARPFQIASIVIDASNLQLAVTPGVASSLSSRSIHDFSHSLHLLSRYLAYLDPWDDSLPPDAPPPATITAVYDGTAYYGEHASQLWRQRDEPGGAPAGGSEDGIRVKFTDGPTASADDELVRMVQECGGEEPRPSRRLSALDAIEALGGELPGPVVAVTRLRSMSGRAQRKQREAFLSSCGLPRVGDMTCLPAFTEAQRSRSIALLRGLKKLQDTVSFSVLDSPRTILVSDDRGLRRRCLALPTPPVVLGSSQLFNWLTWFPTEFPEDEGAPVLVED
ncbi:hypothetical protein AB1Y20_013040 [Prymnesium parvum]|uniref:NYN domain-containing protein n=1 Tax=Prymnesium parvum TaxID=97485 RepID=A0AB34IN28_PRYPA